MFNTRVIICRVLTCSAQAWNMFEEEEEYEGTVDKIWNFAEEVVPTFNDKQFKMHFRMEPTTFEDMLQKLYTVNPEINAVKRGHPLIPLEKQAMITIWCLANIESFRSVSQRFGVTKSTAWDILYRICRNLLKANQTFGIIVWPSPARAELIMDANEGISGIPNVIGFIDGSHIPIVAPREHPNAYYNRKQYHSVVLQGVCDHRKLFTDVYAGEVGSMHDARVYDRSPLKSDIEEHLVDFPHNSHLAGDLAYPLKTTLLAGFKNNGMLTDRQKNFNFRLSQVRVTIENAFALLKGRFRRLKCMETIRLDLICLLITAACILHNICILNGDNENDILNVGDERDEERQGNILIPYDDHNDRNNNAVQKRNNIVNNLPMHV